MDIEVTITAEEGKCLLQNIYKRIVKNTNLKASSFILLVISY